MGNCWEEHCDDFNKWCQLWEKELATNNKTLSKDVPTAEDNNCYFGLKKSTEKDDIPSEDVADWQKTYDVCFDQDKVLTEEKNFKLSKALGDEDQFTHNPVHFASHGMDQSPSPYEPTRVTPNFTDGKELRDLVELKIKLSKLENSLLSADIKEGGKKESYFDQLKDLRKKIDELSDKLTPSPTEDVA
jgi:hypothetical protein